MPLSEVSYLYLLQYDQIIFTADNANGDSDDGCDDNDDDGDDNDDDDNDNDNDDDDDDSCTLIHKPNKVLQKHQKMKH